jgi:hypothetical protein
MFVSKLEHQEQRIGKKFYGIGTRMSGTLLSPEQNVFKLFTAVI